MIDLQAQNCALSVWFDPVSRSFAGFILASRMAPVTAFTGPYAIL
jgi:hypothetical protein